MNTKQLIKRTLLHYKKRINRNQTKPLTILLLTNRDSDNVGDQVIEICDIGLIKTVLKNLNISNDNYKVKSSAAGIITKKYLDTKDPSFIKSAEQKIIDADIIVFGGAPLFNYTYQNFYEKTAITLELAKKHNKPVIFSAIGIEHYDDNNPKCQRLKATLNFDCVKQITTRDNFEALSKFRDKEHIFIDKVADPAVWSAKILEKYISKKSTTKKKIGVFVIRSNGFVDNGVNFTKDDAIELWKDLYYKLEERGYDCEFITSGNFGDEALLTRLFTQHGINHKKCALTMNNPEKLIKKISSYDAVISTRLHPSIISYSLKVPSVGIVWNNKVTKFYDCIGHGDRILTTEGITSEAIIAKIEKAIDEGVNHDEEFLMSIYTSLFNSIKNIICPENEKIKAYTYDELMKNMVTFNGTSSKEKNEKIRRKSKRTYESYNALFDKNLEHQATIRKLKQDILKLEINAIAEEYLKKPSDTVSDFSYELRYHSGAAKSNVSCSLNDTYHIEHLPSGAYEYYNKNEKISNAKSQVFDPCGFEREGYNFKEWILRIKVNDTWFWYMKDDTLQIEDKTDPNFSSNKKRFTHTSLIPYLPISKASVAVAEAIWSSK